ncbi:Branched-chain-amino-acid aminotransferase [compost metagenome]
MPGITRAHVIELAQQLQLHTQDGLYRWEDLVDADEVFLVNSIQEIVPVTTLYTPSGQAHTVGGGSRGPITSQLMQRYV